MSRHITSEGIQDLLDTISKEDRDYGLEFWSMLGNCNRVTLDKALDAAVTRSNWREKMKEWLEEKKRKLAAEEEPTRAGAEAAQVATLHTPKPCTANDCEICKAMERRREAENEIKETRESC